jgi:hypothetical protein
MGVIPVVQTDDSSAQHPHSVVTGLVPVIPSVTSSLKSFAYLSGTIAFLDARDKPGHDGERWGRIGRRFGPLVLIAGFQALHGSLAVAVISDGRPGLRLSVRPHPRQRAAKLPPAPLR